MYTVGYKEYKENSDLYPVISPKNFVVKKKQTMNCKWRFTRGVNDLICIIFCLCFQPSSQYFGFNK